MALPNPSGGLAVHIAVVLCSLGAPHLANALAPGAAFTASQQRAHILDGAAASLSDGNVRKGALTDLLAKLADHPPGAFLQLMAPLVQATTLSYDEPSLVEGVATIDADGSGGPKWERAPALEKTSTRGGVHARVFVSHQTKQAIIAFRGSCEDDSNRQCQVDKCFLRSISAFGSISRFAFPTNANCSQFDSELDYVSQADMVVRAAQAKLVDYAVLLTGHSLGGGLAMVSAARQPGVLQAVTFAPTPFHAVLRQHVGLSEEEISQLPAQDLVATGFLYDLLINTAYVPNARQGATTCLYTHIQTPLVCNPSMVRPQPDSLWVTARRLACKAVSHEWKGYRRLVLQLSADLTPAHLPTCSTSFSTLTDTGFRLLKLARRRW